ncbi:MAG: Smr/MutS family protein [Gammaproteobacteria bacterium]|nr:Smr/MutS family protein [Gammaproteobacteria bacterium]
MKDDDDFGLFRRSVGAVRRLPANGRVAPWRRRPQPVPRQRLADEAQVKVEMLIDGADYAEVETGDELLYARPGVQQNLLRRLRRGHYSIDAELDLHGMFVSEARAALSAFLTECLAGNDRCVRIIHGKGLSSPDRKPVLKSRLNGWLQRCDDVLAFCSARPVDGGTGAVYVLLRNRRQGAP